MIGLSVGIGGFTYLLCFLGIFIVAIGFLKKGEKKKTSESDDKKDEEKTKQGSRVAELEKENRDIRERLRNIELEYLERQQWIKDNEAVVDEKSNELDEGLKEVYGLKEMLEEYRIKFSKLINEKQNLESKVGDLTAKVKNSEHRLGEELATKVKRLEDEKEEIKKNAKEMVLSYKKEVETKMKSLEGENIGLKEEITKMKDQYSAWESIEGL